MIEDPSESFSSASLHIYFKNSSPSIDEVWKRSNIPKDQSHHHMYDKAALIIIFPAILCTCTVSINQSRKNSGSNDLPHLYRDLGVNPSHSPMFQKRWCYWWCSLTFRDTTHDVLPLPIKQRFRVFSHVIMRSGNGTRWTLIGRCEEWRVRRNDVGGLPMLLVCTGEGLLQEKSGCKRTRVWWSWITLDLIWMLQLLQEGFRRDLLISFRFGFGFGFGFVAEIERILDIERRYGMWMDIMFLFWVSGKLSNWWIEVVKKLLKHNMDEAIQFIRKLDPRETGDMDIWTVGILSLNMTSRWKFIE